MNVSVYIFVGKPERKRCPGRFRHRDENNIKIQGARVWTGFKTNVHFLSYLTHFFLQ